MQTAGGKKQVWVPGGVGLSGPTEERLGDFIKSRDTLFGPRLAGMFAMPYVPASLKGWTTTLSAGFFFVG